MSRLTCRFSCNSRIDTHRNQIIRNFLKNKNNSTQLDRFSNNNRKSNKTKISLNEFTQSLRDTTVFQLYTRNSKTFQTIYSIKVLDNNSLFTFNKCQLTYKPDFNNTIVDYIGCQVYIDFGL